MQEWLDLLNPHSLKEILELMVDQGEKARRLRQSTPFAGILTQEERRRIHMWTDDKGVSHVGSFAMHYFVLKSMNPPADPQWQDKLKAEGASVIITVQPVGWIGPWHEDPKPQWIVPLSGRWFIKTMDGTRVEMGPGDICFGEDQNTKPDAFGHKGHYSGTLGKEPAVLMVVQLKDKPTINEPGHFK